MSGKSATTAQGRLRFAAYVALGFTVTLVLISGGSLALLVAVARIAAPPSPKPWEPKPNDDVRIKLMGDHGALVRASVISRVVVDRHPEFTLKIEHVYLGPPELQGVTASAVSGLKLRRTGFIKPIAIEPPLLVGERGIFLLSHGKFPMLEGEIWLALPRNPWPARKNQADNYTAAESLAEAMQLVDRLATRPEQIAKLRKFTKSSTPLVAKWAASIIDPIDRDDAQNRGKIAQLMTSVE